MLPVPPNLPEKYKPLIAILESTLVRPASLAERWGYSDQTLSNHRSQGRGLPFIILPGGAIRYRASEILAAEKAGTRGPLSVDRVALELAAMPDVPEKLQRAIIERLRAVQEGRT